MTLAEFIVHNMEPILVEWEQFASMVPTAAGMEVQELRDDAEAILRRVAADMERIQSNTEQEAKARGQRSHIGENTVAEQHGADRQRAGFSLNEMVSEYRALRANVIRLWTRDMTTADRQTLDELTRFNEGIDQALSESIARYNKHLDRSREIFLGVLGHDLRSPLGAVLASAEYLLHQDSLPPARRAATAIHTSGKRMERMISDLLDVTRTRLGQSLPIAIAPMDLRRACDEAVEEAIDHHPGQEIRLHASGELRGNWDEARLRQVLSNLLENAIRHGDNKVVTVTVEAKPDHVVLSVHNDGPPIPHAARGHLFDAISHGERQSRRSDTQSLGLGLYIVRSIVQAHRGSIDVESSAESGTRFIVRLPT